MKTFLIQLLSINCEYTANSVRPIQDSSICVTCETLCSVVTLMNTLKDIESSDYHSRGLYAVLPAPLALPNPVERDVQLQPRFLVYSDSVWYMLEDDTSLYPRRAMYKITKQFLAKLIV